MIRRRRRKKNRYIKLFFIYLSIIFVLSCIVYFVFLMPSVIKTGVVLDKREASKSISIKLGYSKGTKWIKLKKNTKIPDSIAFDVKLKGYRVESITPCKVYKGKVLKRTSKDIMLDSADLSIKKDVLYAKISDGALLKVPANNLIVGSSTSFFICDNNGQVSTVLVGEPDIEYIRIGISNMDFSSLNHSKLLFSSKKSFVAEFNGNEYKIPKNNILKAEFKNGQIELTINTKNNDDLVLKTVLGATGDRIKISPTPDYSISVSSLKRKNGYTPSYYGAFELFTENDSMRLINEVSVEDYLKYVVPSEMLGSGGVEGYKVQAVAARTYVLSDLLSGRFSSYGFHVDDTTQSQVYNSMPSNPQCDNAVEETAGLIMTYEGKIIDAKYYSTSCGLGAPFNQIWYNGTGYKGNNPEPYLEFNDYTQNNIKDLSREEDAANFFKDWTIKSYDSDSPYFRWKFTMDKKTLNETVNSNIYERYKKKPESFKKLWNFNIYRKTVIPEEGIGKIEDIYISKRGKAGNVLEMTIISETGTYRIEGDINIKRLLTPKDMVVTPIYGKKKENLSSFLSSFFIIDKELQNKSIKQVTIYGGGYGHGVGMSQYGVISLVRTGKNFKEILSLYYNNINFSDYHDLIKSLK